MVQQSQKNAQIACLPKIQALSMLTSQHFAGLSILTLEINPENFRSMKIVQKLFVHDTHCRYFQNYITTLVVDKLL